MGGVDDVFMDESAAGRFDGFVSRLAGVIGHADRHAPLRAYVTGLLLPGDRKSVEPMAARLAPRDLGRVHQSLHHFVSTAAWDCEALLMAARDYALSQLERHAPVAAWIVDDTGIPKKGDHSVGVTRQYCGALGKTANCQVAVCVSLANRVMSVPAAWQLFLPKEWVEDEERRARAGVPAELGYRSKWQIALAEVDRLLADDLPPAPVVADSAYGDVTAFREGVMQRGLPYAMAIRGATTVWPPGRQPLPPVKQPGSPGKPRTRVRREKDHKPVSVERLARSLTDDAWHTLTWREGSKGTITSRFAALRIRPAHRDNERSEARPVEWLLIEWAQGDNAPGKYWLSTLPEHVAVAELVTLAKLRWRVERDFQELKDELGLDHYEGRNYRGFHNHGVLCIAAYCFLAAERGRLSPLATLSFLQSPQVPRGFKPRGAANQTRTP